MKSRITIEVDFENGNQSIIQIQQHLSDDVRDKLLASFTQQFGGSSWCQIKWQPKHSMDEPTFINITPINPLQLKDQAEIMLEQHRLNEEWRQSQVVKKDYNP
jgi:hypothetical protein